MQTIRVTTAKPYDVVIAGGLLAEAPARIAAIAKTKKVMLVTDDIVHPLYGETLQKALADEGFSVALFVFPHGEASKRLSTVEALLEEMAAQHFGRSDLVLALGGGVVGDMAGFAAAVYARGMDFVQIPTTLLAAVDSSVGGKTAVDLSRGKNLCGAFHQPKLVLCDTDTLHTLRPLQIEDGLAEMLKYGVICDVDLFEKVKNYKNEDMEVLIARCVEIKRDVVAEDEFDRGTRMLLNLGHTIGHAVEAASAFSVTHGHGVAIGMAIIARAAEKKGMATAGTAKAIEDALTACGLPTRTEYAPELLAALAASDKKTDGGVIRLILPRTIGDTGIHTVPQTEILDFIKAGL